jgi:hypothetical protein
MNEMSASSFLSDEALDGNPRRLAQPGGDRLDVAKQFLGVFLRDEGETQALLLGHGRQGGRGDAGDRED